MKLLLNPFCNDIFIPVLTRLAIILIIGALGIWIASFKCPNKLTKEMWLRYFSWVMISPLFLCSVFCGPLPALLVYTFVSYRAIKEFITVTRLPRGYNQLLYLLIPLSIVFVFLDHIGFLPILYLAITTVVAIKKNSPKELNNLLITLLGSFWILYLFNHSTLLIKSANGPFLFTLTGFSVALCDIGNFTMGKIVAMKKGVSKLTVASNISPDKTYVGYLGGLIGVSATVGLFLPMTKVLSLTHIMLFIIAIPCCAAIGDLSESLFKRFFTVKDSSSFIPGHGGVLDRLDSFLPSVATVYYLSLLFQGA